MKRVDRRIKNCNFARKLTRLELSLIIVVFLLWYEYGLAKVLFVEQRKPSLKDVSKLTREDLELYSIEGNSAAEDTWNRTVFGDGTKYNETTIPWHRSSKESNYFDWILDEKKYQRDYPHWRKKRRLEFIVGFKSTGTYQVLRRGACERMTIFRTEPELYKFGAGWIFAATIPEAFRLAVDRDIAKVKLRRELQRVALENKGTLDTPNCKRVFWDIGIGIVGILVLLCTVPCFVVLIVILCWHCLERIPRPRKSRHLD